MAYDGRALRRAMARYDEDKQRRAAEFAARQRALYTREPRLQAITRELGGTMAKLTGVILRRDGDTEAAVAALREESLALQAERARLLRELGEPPDALTAKPACPRCGDTGWLEGGGMCGCLRACYTRAQNEELSRMLDLGSQRFERFDFNYYARERAEGQNLSPRTRMEKNFEACRDFAFRFPDGDGNLLLSGDPGLGKTFLSACVARVVSEAGYSVVYDTAAHVFDRFETQKFTRDEESGEDVRRVLRCDLLILDDLGTELTTAYVQSALYSIVNTRLVSRRKTIVSTNLSPEDLGRRYGAALRSRLEGEYRILPFFGEDIRLLKRKNAR